MQTHLAKLLEMLPGAFGHSMPPVDYRPWVFDDHGIGCSWWSGVLPMRRSDGDCDWLHENIFTVETGTLDRSTAGHHMMLRNAPRYKGMNAHQWNLEDHRLKMTTQTVADVRQTKPVLFVWKS